MRKKTKLNYESAKGILFLFLVSSIFSQAFFPLLKASAEERTGKKEQGQNVPIKVTSERMVSEKKENKIFFYGDVVAVRGELTINSDELEVYTGSGGSKPEIITARGNVVIDSKDRHATGQKAVYYDLTQRIILTGNPRAWEGKNEITGDEMIFIINEDKFIVNSSKGKGKQIELILFPNKENKEGKDKDEKKTRKQRK